MASVSTTKTGSRRLYYFDSNGERRILYLGKLPKKQAESIASHVEAIVAAKAAKTSIALDDAIWLSEIGNTLHAKLVKHGLATARQLAGETEESVDPKQIDLGPFLADYIAKRTDVEIGTRWNYLHVQRNLIDYFGVDKRLTSITFADADDFRLWLSDKEDLAEATVRKRCSIARQFFRRALKAQLINENPFGELKNLLVGPSPEERVFFVGITDFEKVMGAIPAGQLNLRTMFALARWGGLRCPSEPAALKWGHVDLKKGRLTVRSPKTGKREMPLFPELRQYLVAAFRHAESLGKSAAGDPVITRGDGSTNWRSTLEDAICRAGLLPWPKLYQNLRSSRETELMKRHPIAVVCAWLGNSPKIALKHYHQVTDADFDAALGKKKATQNATQSAADKAGLAWTGKDSNPQKRGKSAKPAGRGDELVVRLGFEPRTKGL